MESIKQLILKVVKSSAFKRALWNFANAVIVLVVQQLTSAGIIESGLAFALLNGVTKELNLKYGNIK